MMIAKIPSKEDWGVLEDDLETRFAFDFYLGKSNDEMSEHYLIGPGEVAEELQYMPSKPFQYYIIGFRDSVLSKEHDELGLYTAAASDAASSFLHLIIRKLKHRRSDILPIIHDLLASVDYIADNQEADDADIESEHY